MGCPGLQDASVPGKGGKRSDVPACFPANGEDACPAIAPELLLRLGKRVIAESLNERISTSLKGIFGGSGKITA